MSAHFWWQTAAALTLGLLLGFCLAKLRRDEEPWWLSAWLPASIAILLFGVLMWIG